MKHWQTQHPPYEGDAPYLYFAFAEADSAKAWRVMRILLARGCRVWYSSGAAGGAEELLRRQARAGGAVLTLLYLTDSVCADKDCKSNVLVNQKFGRPILCLDPDGTDRRLNMGLREDVPHIPLYRLGRDEDVESALIRAEGFSQEVLGDPVKVGKGTPLGALSGALGILAALALVISFAGYRYLGWFRPEIRDEVPFTDTVLHDAMRDAAGGGAITEALTSELRTLRLDGLPERWDELEKLPALERIVIPQSVLLTGGALPNGDYVIELSGGDGA